MKRNLAKFVNREQVLSALQYIDENKIPLRTSTGFDLVYNGKRYPPKAVIREAAKLSGITDLSQYRLNGGPPTNEPLQEMGFAIQGKLVRAASTTPKHFLDLLLSYLDNTPTGMVFGDYTYQEKNTSLFYGTPGGHWDPQENPGYIFSNETFQWILRFALEHDYVVVESIHRKVQLMNFSLIPDHTFCDQGSN
jgi:hypothetical protein